MPVAGELLKLARKLEAPPIIAHFERDGSRRVNQRGCNAMREGVALRVADRFLRRAEERQLLRMIDLIGTACDRKLKVGVIFAEDFDGCGVRVINPWNDQ